MFYFGKASQFLFLFISHRHLLFVRRNQQGNLAFRMTRAEDTHLTLASIPFLK